MSFKYILYLFAIYNNLQEFFNILFHDVFFLFLFSISHLLLLPAPQPGCDCLFLAKRCARSLPGNVKSAKLPHFRLSSREHASF